MATIWVRFFDEGQYHWGQLHGDWIQVFTGSPFDPTRPCGPHPTIERLPLAMTALAPPCQPTKIVCVGRNYREHAKELGHPVPTTPLFFLKPPSSLLAPGGEIELPPLSNQVEHEGELGIVIGRRCRKLAADADVRPYIFGLTCVNDVTARDLQNSDPQWTRAKGFDTFCPIGPVVVASTDTSDLTIETRVNGELRQRGHTRDFIFSLPQVFAAITAVMTLEPGDIIATGTPAGVGPLRDGDMVEVSIAGVGKLVNRCRAT
ncbi:MAG TPA: fumarylacetoacetate hydrolase family protein [Terriglobales bacterium]|jgi:2-keto-4-pentenoate hydratase/2-oxohepta-3-ene-1,7-dioic acid hydratase in catechol pathway